MPSYAIIGFGCAGYHAAQAIRARDAESPIHVFGDPPGAPANPMLTTYYVKDVIPFTELFPFGESADVLHELRLTFHGESRVRSVDPGAMQVTLENGETGRFDKILLATGASAFVPPFTGAEYALCMRTPEDARVLRELLDEGRIKKGLVVGASMTGIKVTELLYSRGIDCVLADAAPWIFPLAAFEETARKIEFELQKRGIETRFGTALQKLEKVGQKLTAQFQNAPAIDADAVILCIGTKANIASVEGTGIQTARGILVDDGMHTSAKNVFAAGDCCEARELQSGNPMVIGLWANAGFQGRVAGENMAGGHTAFDYSMVQNISHFLGLDFVGIGNLRACTPTGEKRIFQNDRYLIVAARSEGRVECLNLLGPPQCSGILRNRMMKAFGGTEKNPELQRGLLAQFGLPSAFLDWIEDTRQEVKE